MLNSAANCLHGTAEAHSASHGKSAKNEAACCAHLAGKFDCRLVFLKGSLNELPAPLFDLITCCPVGYGERKEASVAPFIVFFPFRFEKNTSEEDDSLTLT